MFPIMQVNQPPNDSFHRHLGNYRSLLFTPVDDAAGADLDKEIIAVRASENKKTYTMRGRRSSGCKGIDLIGIICGGAML